MEDFGITGYFGYGTGFTYSDKNEIEKIKVLHSS